MNTIRRWIAAALRKLSDVIEPNAGGGTGEEE